MDAGKLVPDEVIIGIVTERLAQGGLPERLHSGRGAPHHRPAEAWRKQESHLMT